MPEQFAAAQLPLIEGTGEEMAAPVRFLTSDGAGWEGLAVHAYHEPMTFEGWIASDVPDISLVLFTGGPMQFEQRSINSPWRGRQMQHDDLFLRTGKGAPYELRWQGLSSEPTQTLHVHLSKELVSRTAEELSGHDPARLTLVERVGFQDPLLAQVGLALRRELEQGAPAGKLYAQTAAQLLAVHLLRHYASPVREIKEYAQGLTRQQLKRVTDFIRAHLGQDLSLETLAEQIGFSVYYFARQFQQTLGVSPHQFVLYQRIERAQRLLQETEMSLAGIALECGFANQSHLTQAFKRQLGYTPHHYRRERWISANF